MEVSLNISDRELEKSKPFKQNMEGKPKSKKRKWISIVLTLLLISALGVGIYSAYKGYKITKDIGFNFDPGQLIEKPKEPELKKDSTGKFTNVLLVGIDTREKTKLLNTDVLIVASYNYETKNIVMVSIPRDFEAQVNPDKYWFNKINSSYAVNEQKKEGSGLPQLQRVVEGVTGMEIQYYAMIDFKGFVDLIDSVGGIYVNVENSFTDYKYPLGNGYQKVSFTSGPQLMDGDTALKYSRSRHSQQNGEGSDYARARRQQKVLTALKDVILTSETLLNPTKIMGMITAIQDNIKISEFTLDDIEAGVNILKELKDSTSESYSFVLDPMAGNKSLIAVQPTVAYSIAPIAGLGKYDNIHEYLDLVLANPKLYSENPSIYVYNAGLGSKEASEKTKELKLHFKYLNIVYKQTLYSDKEGIHVFSNKDAEFEYSVNQLSKYLKTENILKPEYITTKLNREDISILLGKEPIVVQDIQESTN
ncbi:MAG: cell envelope-related transcriptional attenuator [candidate division WS6 bacterium GW2011_GWE2_33_157]|nr:MAG: cell envelope-related transcriptional attenuator [candidate division WS6 bacterium GW2011_GWE2_33_157]KKP45381.1 MAG: cell envelope-related transcriptional attenuator [candidate division WS6 bacterium GW2011_GWF1_33_233]KKP54691.1 MAG: cell envelope-related transcriptional attenuator [candidate division WS6 bacterium GW2011_WS6_33_547]KKP56711.1 MAG: Transcriptional regulator LytR [candidate division WS6 bacterium GW2011_GWF2_33_92]KKP81925.1 MAG: Transcriptional regulator LytR [candida